MSDLIGNDDMRLFGGQDDAALESAIRGSASADPALSLLVERVLASSEQPLSGAVAEAHVSAAALAARQVAVNAGDAAAPVVQPTSRRRRFAYAGVTSGIVAKVLFGAVALATVTGGAAAATGHLPAGVQDAVADVIEHVGIDLPGGHGELSAAPADTTTTTEEPVTGPDESVEAYTDAVDEWTRCVQEREPGEDGKLPTPQEACGEHPDPHDFDVPGNGRPEGDSPGNSGDAPGRQDDSPGNSDNAPGNDHRGGKQGTGNPNG